MADDRGCGAPRPPGAECRRRQAAPQQDLWDHDAAAEPRELLDDRRDGFDRHVQASVAVRVVVTSITLVPTREPQRAALRGGRGAAVPPEAAVQRQAKDSA